MDPTKSSAATAAGIAADYSARATYARGYEDGSKHVDEVGLQLVALRERLRLAMAVVEAARDAFSCLAEISVSDVPPYALSHNETAHLEQAGDILHAALAALDAVPGDALASSGRLAALDARWVGPDGEPER
jgi:hypothetical protein